MTLFDSIFGSSAQNAGMNNYLGNPAQAMANNQLANQYQGGLAQQQAYSNAQQSLFNSMMNQRTARWMIDGEVCYSVKDFAKKLYPDDEGAQMMIVLRFGDV